MKLSYTACAVLAIATLSGIANAQEAKTRAQVREELAQAQASGDIIAPGDSGLTLRQLYPNRYPSRQAAASTTRAEVVAELQEARRNGDVMTGDTGLTEYELHPQNYPTRVLAKGKTRDEARAELAEAIRTGQIVAAGESGLTLREEYPHRYASVKANERRAQAATDTTLSAR